MSMDRGGTAHRGSPQCQLSRHRNEEIVGERRETEGLPSIGRNLLKEKGEEKEKGVKKSKHTFIDFYSLVMSY